MPIHTRTHARAHARAHAHPFNGPFSRTTQVSRYQKGKTNLDFSEARDSEWQWHQLGHMSASRSRQDNHASSPPLSFLPARCPSCCQTNSVKALPVPLFKIFFNIIIHGSVNVYHHQWVCLLSCCLEQFGTPSQTEYTFSSFRWHLKTHLSKHFNTPIAANSRVSNLLVRLFISRVLQSL